MAVVWKKILFSGGVGASDFASQAAATILGNATGGSAAPTAMNKATALGLLNVEDGADATDVTNVLAALAGDLGGDVTFGNQASDTITVGGDIQLGGGDIKSSGGTTAISVSGANATIAGDLTVSGATITTTTESLEIADNKMVLNSDLGNSVAEPASGTGFTVKRGVTTTGSITTPAGNYWVMKQLAGRWRIGESKTADISGANYTEHGLIAPLIQKAGAPTTELAGGEHYGFAADTTNGALYWRVGNTES